MQEKLAQAGQRDTGAGDGTAVTVSSPAHPVLADETPDVATFWVSGPGLPAVDVSIEAPERPLAILERLGPSPFPRTAFPLIGFLATTYDKVSRYALNRG